MIKAVIFDLDNTLLDFMSMKNFSIKSGIKAMIESGLNIDPDRLAISGDSGVGYICLATMVLIAYDHGKNGDIVKLAIPEIPMCSDYCFSDMKAIQKRKERLLTSCEKTG